MEIEVITVLVTFVDMDDGPTLIFRFIFHVHDQ